MRSFQFIEVDLLDGYGRPFFYWKKILKDTCNYIFSMVTYVYGGDNMKQGNVNMCIEVPKEYRDYLKILAIKNNTDLKSLVKKVLDQYIEENK